MQSGWNLLKHFCISSNIDNMVAHVLSKRYNLFTSLTAKILRLEHITELYRDDQDFRTIYASCVAKKSGG